MNPSMNLIVESCITLSRQIAAVEVRRKMERIGMSLFQAMNRLYFIAATRDVVKANNPDNAVASPYEGIRKGSRVIMKMPNPNPVVLCTKLAPTARRNICRIFSVKNNGAIAVGEGIKLGIQKQHIHATSVECVLDY